MALLTEDVLWLWRELERVHDDLPKGTAGRVKVQEHITAVHGLYTRMTDSQALTRDKLESSDVVMDGAMAALVEVRKRLPRS